MMKKRIMDFLKISENDYSMVFTANKSSAFKLVSESYPFQCNRKLLTVYDYKSEAVDSMISTSEKRGARVMAAEFKWPRLRIRSDKLRNMIITKKKTKKTNRGLFVFPLQSRLTGASYSYQWMSVAQENGWHVLLDACALGPKDMDSFGLSLIHPDFLVCSFYKVFGENPTGFACLIVKKSIISNLESSTCTGVVSLVPTENLPRSPDDSSGTDTDICEELVPYDASSEIECRGLDHVDSLGLMLISSRGRCLINWIINALLKLQHPDTENKIPLVRIYGPKVKFDRGPAIAFNLYDWKGEKVEPVLIQKLADRSNISLSHGFLHQIWFDDKYEEEKNGVMERRKVEENTGIKKIEQGISVVTTAIAFLANFEDAYRFWSFIARFLDADFVEKERWRYTALNQKTIDV
jgi:selenocysteine lyase/cysteine desulfurase